MGDPDQSAVDAARAKFEWALRFGASVRRGRSSPSQPNRKSLGVNIAATFIRNIRKVIVLPMADNKKASYCMMQKFPPTMTLVEQLQDQINLEAEIGRLLTEKECQDRYKCVPVKNYQEEHGTLLLSNR